MNKYEQMRRFNFKLLSLALLSIFVISFVVMSCEPETKVTFQNQRNEDLDVFVASVRRDGSIDGFVDYGTIPSQTTKTIYITFLGDEWVNRIEIRDTLGKVVFSHDYNRPDLEKIGWKITIPP